MGNFILGQETSCLVPWSVLESKETEHNTKQRKPKNICRLFESTMNELTIKRKQFQPENKRDLDDNSRSNINAHKSVLTQRNGCTNE